MNEIIQTVQPERFVTTGVEKIRTMIEGFDDISHGGMPIGRTTLVSGTSGTGKTLFAVQFIYNGITHFDEPGVLVTFEESPADIIKNAETKRRKKEDMLDFVNKSYTITSL